jgi:peptidoglycan/LPS O-acetylase OafA/YrhL
MLPLSASGGAVDRKSLSAVRGLDTLRFVAAAWVAFSHGAAPPLRLIPGADAGALHWVSAGFEAAYNGTAAVVVFFLISGFCIHLPNLSSDRLNWPRFLVRRFVRIGLPLLAIICLAHGLGDRFVGAEDAVLWSVYCELVYYALYPALFVVLRLWPLSRILAASAAISLVLLAFNPRALLLWHFGPLTWLFCAPFWLLGAWLAEQYARGEALRLGSVWLWRAGAVAGCVAATVALYHLPVKIGYAWTMPPFALYVLLWLKREIAEGEDRGAIGFLEALGASSYSLYLMHKVVLEGLGVPTSAGDWALTVAAIAGATGVLYLLVEYPSHQLARWLGRRPTASTRREPARA